MESGSFADILKDTFLADILKNTIANVATDGLKVGTGFAATLAGRWAYGRWNAFSKLTGLKRGKASCLLTYGLIEPSNYRRDQYFSAEEGDVEALAQMAVALHKRLKPAQIHIAKSADARGPLLQGCHTIISLSGAMWNPVTAHLLKSFDLPITFNETKKEITLPNNDGSLHPEMGALGKPKTCYGLIFRGQLKNQSLFSQNVIIICGLSTLSTYGAARIFADIDQHLKPHNTKKTGEQFLAICKVEAPEPFNGTAYPHALPIRNELLKLSIVKLYDSKVLPTLKKKHENKPPENNPPLEKETGKETGT